MATLKTKVLSGTLALLVLVMGASVFAQQSIDLETEAIENIELGYNLNEINSCPVDKVAPIQQAKQMNGENGLVSSAPYCNKPGSCTPGQTYCENRSPGGRETTCNANGEWGPWNGCGRHISCSVGGMGGSC